jgi:hypothetical protein
MKMLSADKIEAIATQVAQANLTPQVVQRAISTPIVDSEGVDALLLTIVITAGSADTIDGSKLLDTLVATQHELQEAGEDRHAVLSYATEEELADGGDQP